MDMVIVVIMVIIVIIIIVVKIIHSKILKAPVPEISPLFAMFLIICNYPRKHTTKPFELYQVENDKQQKLPTIIQVNHTASSSNYDYDDDLDVCAIFLDR